MAAAIGKLEQFTRSDPIYKTVNNQDMRCTIWVPKDPPMKPLPPVVRWHGGGLVTRERDGELYFLTW